MASCRLDAPTLYSSRLRLACAATQLGEYPEGPPPASILATVPIPHAAVRPTHVLAIPYLPLPSPGHPSPKKKHHMLPIHDTLFLANCSSLPALPRATLSPLPLAPTEAQPEPRRSLYTRSDFRLFRLPVVRLEVLSPDSVRILRDFFYKPNYCVIYIKLLGPGPFAALKDALNPYLEGISLDFVVERALRVIAVYLMSGDRKEVLATLVSIRLLCHTMLELGIMHRALWSSLDLYWDVLWQILCEKDGRTESELASNRQPGPRIALSDLLVPAGDKRV